jgi:PKD domain-containing protein
MAPRALTFAFAAAVITVLVIFTLLAGPPSTSIGLGTASDGSAPASELEASFTEGSTLTGTCQPITVTVSLTGNATGGIPPYNFTWHFGPGSPLSYGPETNHTYDAAGTYNVTLSVLDSVGDSVSAIHQVGAPPPPCAPPVLSTGASPLSWQFYAIFVGTGLGFALLGAVVWFRRK